MLVDVLWLMLFGIIVSSDFVMEWKEWTDLKWNGRTTKVMERKKVDFYIHACYITQQRTAASIVVMF
jgi:hypothetical protein